MISWDSKAQSTRAMIQTWPQWVEWSNQLKILTGREGLTLAICICKWNPPCVTSLSKTWWNKIRHDRLSVCQHVRWVQSQIALWPLATLNAGPSCGSSCRTESHWFPFAESKLAIGRLCSTCLLFFSAPGTPRINKLSISKPKPGGGGIIGCPAPIHFERNFVNTRVRSS